MITAFPQYLWLLPLALIMAAACWRWHAGPRRRLVAVLRGVCVATIVLALAEPMLRTRVARQTHVTVLDLGPTIPGPTAGEALERLQGHPAGDSRVVVFSNRAELLPSPLNLRDPGQLATLRSRLAWPVATDDLKTGGSALAAALQLAGAQIAPGGRGEIELLSNGLATRGDAEAEAYRLATRGIAVRVTPVAVSPSGDVPAVVRAVRAPASAGAGETVTVGVVVEAAQACDGVVTLASSGLPVSSRVRLSSGDQTVRLSMPMGAPGLTPVAATVVVDGHPASDAVVAAVDVRPGARVLMVRQQDGGATADALGMLLGRSAMVESIAPGELAGHPLDGYGAVVLADVPADALTGDAQHRIRDAVLNGTGLLLTGAARSFGPGGYEESPLSSLLPVRMPQQAESIDPSTTLVLIIDTSGSMQEFQRIDLAKEVAHLAISHLKPHDKVGIVEFYGGKRWAAPIQSAANTAVIGRVEPPDRRWWDDVVPRRGRGGVCSGERRHAEQTRTHHQRRRGRVGTVRAAAPPNERGRHRRFGRLRRAHGRRAEPDARHRSLGRGALLLGARPLRPARHHAQAAAGVAVVARRPRAGQVGRRRRRPGPRGRRRNVGTGERVRPHGRPAHGGRAAPNDRRRPVAGPLAVRSGVRRRHAHAAGVGHDQVAAGRRGLRQAGRRPLSPDRAGPPGHARRPAVNAAGWRRSERHGPRPRRCRRRRPTAAHPGRRAWPSRAFDTAEAVDRGRWNVLLPGVTDGRYRVSATIAGTSAAGEGGLSVNGPRVVPRLTPDLDLLNRLTAFNRLATERAAQLPPTTESFTGLRSELVALAVLVFLFEVAARRYPERVRQAS